MTVQQLIDLLNKIEDKSKQVKISVHQYNKVYPVAYTNPSGHDYLEQNDATIRINTWLPDNMHTVERKK